MIDGVPAQGREAGAWHALAVDDALVASRSDALTGLSETEARERLQRVGPNALPEAKGRSVLLLFLQQFRSPLIYLLFGVAAVALALGHSSDATVIFVVVLLNAFIGALQEGRAERSLEALRKLTRQQARVVRDGTEQMIEAAQVVPGDIVLLDAGDAIVADVRLLDGAALQIAEAAMTGESVPVSKTLGPVPRTPRSLTGAT